VPDATTRPSRRESALVLAALVLSVLLATEAVRFAIAGKLGESTEIPQIRRALVLDPANPKLYHQLGMQYYTSLEQTNLEDSVEDLRRATELRPEQAFYWSDLASVCEALGDGTCADRAIRRALTLSPMTPQVEWQAANYDLRTGRKDEALAGFRRLVTLDPSYAASTFAVCLKVLDDPAVISQKVVPPQIDLQLAYVNALMKGGKADFAHEVWVQAISNAPRFPFALARPYLERLIELGRGREAEAVWQDLLKLGVVIRPASEDQDNLIFNGDFEQVPLNAGFDWRYQETRYLALDLADPSAYNGHRCLRVDFVTSRNEEYEPVYEIVRVVPLHSYLLSAYVRTEGITSDAGPRLRVTDPVCPTCLEISTDGVAGTTPWHRVSVRFSTGASTLSVKVSVWRPRSRTFPTEVTGTFWLDQVLLKATPSNEPVSASNSLP